MLYLQYRMLDGNHAVSYICVKIIYRGTPLHEGHNVENDKTKYVINKAKKQKLPNEEIVALTPHARLTLLPFHEDERFKTSLFFNSS